MEDGNFRPIVRTDLTVTLKIGRGEPHLELVDATWVAAASAAANPWRLRAVTPNRESSFCGKPATEALDHCGLVIDGGFKLVWLDGST